jgi:uncharacterized protein YciI
MTLFAVTREAGPAWIEGHGAFEQPAVDEHAAFMADLAAEGVVLFAGPLAGTESTRIRVLLIANGVDEADVRRRLADDPWEVSERIRTAGLEPWTLFVGADRLQVLRAM